MNNNNNHSSGLDKYEELIQSVHRLNSRIGGEWEPQWQLLWIYEELGELSRELQKRQALPAKLHNDNRREIDQKLVLELGDVMYGLVSLAKNLNIDLLDALVESVKKFEYRHR